MPSVMATADEPMQPFQTWLSFLPSPRVVNSPFLVPHRNSAQLEQKKNIWKWNEWKKKSVFLQMKHILLAQQVHRFQLEFHAEKKNHVIKVAVLVLHCEWSLIVCWNWFFFLNCQTAFHLPTYRRSLSTLTPSSKEVKHWAITNCFIWNSFGLFSQPNHWTICSLPLPVPLVLLGVCNSFSLTLCAPVPVPVVISTGLNAAIVLRAHRANGNSQASVSSLHQHPKMSLLLNPFWQLRNTQSREGAGILLMENLITANCPPAAQVWELQGICVSVPHFSQPGPDCWA